MVDITGLYFVITDGGHARFVRPGPDSRLHTIRVVGHSDEAKPDTRPDSSTFVRRLAGRINDDFATDLFSHFVLVAPAKILPELASMIDEPTSECLIGRLAMDLISVPDTDLWPHLDAWVQPACRV